MFREARPAQPKRGSNRSASISHSVSDIPHAIIMGEVKFMDVLKDKIVKAAIAVIPSFHIPKTEVTIAGKAKGDTASARKVSKGSESESEESSPEADEVIESTDNVFEKMVESNIKNFIKDGLAKHYPAFLIRAIVEARIAIRDKSAHESDNDCNFTVPDVPIDLWMGAKDKVNLYRLRRILEMPFFMHSRSSVVSSAETLVSLLESLVKAEFDPSGFNAYKSSGVSEWLDNTFLGWHCAHESEDGVAYTAAALAPKAQKQSGGIITAHLQRVGGIHLVDNASAASKLLFDIFFQSAQTDAYYECMRLFEEVKGISEIIEKRDSGEAGVPSAELDTSSDTVLAGTYSEEKPPASDAGDSTHGVESINWPKKKEKKRNELEKAIKRYQAQQEELIYEDHAYRLFMTLLFNGGKGTLVRGESPIVLVNPVVVHVHGTYLSSMATECAVRGYVEPAPSFSLVEQIVIQELMKEYRGTKSLFRTAGDPRLSRYQRKMPHKNALWHRLDCEDTTIRSPTPPSNAREILLVGRKQENLPKNVIEVKGEGKTTARMSVAPKKPKKKNTNPKVYQTELEQFCNARIKLAVNTAAAFQAAAVIFVAQADAGSKFRDREGRAAAQLALEEAVRAMLFDV